MANLIFKNDTSGNRSLYIGGLDDTSLKAVPPGKFWCAYLLPQGAIPSVSSIPFDKSPQYQGFYIFASTPPADVNTFVSNAQSYFSDIKKPYQAGGIAWFSDPDKSPTADNVQLIYLQASDNGFTLLCAYNFNFGNNFCTLTLTPNIALKISIDAVNNRFIITGPPSPLFINLDVNDISSVIKPMNEMEIPLTGEAMGGLRFIAGLHDGIEFNALEVAQKFFFSNADGVLTEISYPSFQNASQNSFVYFQISLNPIDLLNENAINTYLAFLGYSKSNPDDLTKYDTVLSSNFRSDNGIPFNLVPFLELSTSNGSLNIPGIKCARLTFCERPESCFKGKWYTIPTGNFTLALNNGDEKYLDANKQLRLLCGLSGTETISITPKTQINTGDFLRFTANNPAYAQQFPITNPGNIVGSNTKQQWLSQHCVTAWAGVEKGSDVNSDIVYHSQPQGSSLFTPSKANNSEGDGFLEYFLANSGTLSKAPATIFFPLVGYGRNVVVPDGVSVSLFEFQIINPARRYYIANGVKSVDPVPDSGTIIASTSPQGFYIEVDSASAVWKRMLLASNQFFKSNGQLSQVFNLAFNNLGPVLQSAFQTNQLFLVISSNKNNVLGDFESLMEVEEWPFQLRVPQISVPGKYQNVIIFKFCNESLQQRVQNIQYWTNPEDFNDNSQNGLPNISMWLNDYIQKGIDKYRNQHDNDYYKFCQVATDPDWKGVLSLKVDISIDNFPPELQGLLAGIDTDGLNAHHFGIDLSVVHNEGGTLSMKPTSSLFGLIDYEDPVFGIYNSNIDTYKAEAPINSSVDYVYNVLMLKVLFQNSKILNFNSYIAFTINKLFGEKVIADNRANLLLLDGTYENHNGVPSYTFNAKGDNLLLLDSSIIRHVEILKSTFVTQIKDSRGANGNVESLFSFFGYINFKKLEGFDLLSFGGETDDAIGGQGISFSNLNISLVFPLDTPTNQTYAFDISQISFDLGASYARKDSLYRHFPLQLNGMVSGNSKDNPASQGYLNVSLPALKQQQAISGDWYGLTFKLNMGTLGSLASSAGFNTIFLAAWTVGGSGAAAGLKLPGVNPQAPALSLQGVLKLDIGSLSLNIADDGVSYLMKINNIALKVLSLTFPSNATIGFYLFGNPSSDAPPESLGWYAGYVKK